MAERSLVGFRFIKNLPSEMFPLILTFDFCLSTSIPVLTTSTRVVAWLLPQLKVECTFCSDVCGTFEALTQRIQMYRDVADAKS